MEIHMRNLTDADWAGLETWLSGAFIGTRKDGSPEALHSIRIGRALRDSGEDDITVFGGYCHDVIEDIVGQDEGSVRQLALGMFGDPDAAVLAAALVVECSYNDEEYARSKADRKTAACARWVSTDNLRVAAVKIEDVRDNAATASGVPHPFERDYLAWAAPLKSSLEDIVAARGVRAVSP